MLTKLWNYIKSIWEGEDNRLSLRRLVAILLAWLIVHLTVKEKIQTQLQLDALYSIEMLFLLLIGIITTNNLLTFFNKGKDEK